MKHSIKEIYKVYNTITNITKLATSDYITENEIATPNFSERRNHLVYARPLDYYSNNNKPIKVLDANDTTKIIYLFGEKTWFDTQEELDKYREEYQAWQTATAERNKVKKAIIEKLDNYTTEQLLAMLENM